MNRRPPRSALLPYSPLFRSASSTTSCMGASQGGSCDNDAADHCTGTSNSCVDVFQSSTFVCRASAGQCDVDGKCTRLSCRRLAVAFALFSLKFIRYSPGGTC